MRASARLGGCSIQSGRRGLQLAARQAEVLHFLRAAGLDEDCYFAQGARASEVPEFSGALVPHLPGGPPELNPYRGLGRRAHHAVGPRCLGHFQTPWAGPSRALP